MSNEVKTIKRSPWQVKVWNDDNRFLVINCGRRAGKSTIAAIKMLHFASENAGSTCWYIAPNYKQAESIMWAMLTDLIPHQAILKKNEQKLLITLINGSQIHLKGAEDPDTLRGVKIDLAIFDEVAFMSRWFEVWKVMRPTLADSMADVWFISTPNGFNHFKELADKRDKGWSYHHYTTYDNPYIPREEIEQMRIEMDEDAFAQEVMGEFKRMTGLVYKDFNRDIHVKELEDFEEEFYLRGVDRGFRNPTAVMYVMVDKDDTWYVVDEIYKTRLTNPMLSEELKAKDAVWGIDEFELSTMDSAQAGDIAELQDLGHDFLPTTKQSGEKTMEYVRWKISKLTERLRAKKVFIHPRCENLIREFETYAYKSSRIGETENPEKVGDHALDSLGDLNAMYSHFYKEKKKDISQGRLKGTYVRESKPDESGDFYDDIDIANTF